MRAVTTCIFLALFTRFITAQNLIPDSSFEKNKFVPMDFSEVNASQLWSIPSWGTSDLYCKCDRKTKIFREKIYSQVDVPQNLMGYQDPHSGTCYAGMFVFSHGNYREYLQTPLTAPLEKNKTYLFTIHISLADYSRASIDQLGVCFLKNKVEYKSSDVITDLCPLYFNIDRAIGKDVKGWHRLSVTYKASGGEMFILFGSFEINKIKKTKFKAPKEIKTRINQITERDSYYFFDDLSLIETILVEQIDTVVNLEPEAPNKIISDTLFVLKNILFQTNQTILLQDSYKELDLLVEYLKKISEFHLEIIGHTDNSGKEPKNKTLSIGRAKTVAEYLILHGIDRSRINYIGCGSTKPIASNQTEKGKKQNRRVEFIIHQK